MQIQSLKAINGHLYNISHNLNGFDIYPEPNSPNVAFIAFNRRQHLIFVQFTNGKRYFYIDVTEEAIDKWYPQRPAGSYLANVIKGHFRYQQVEEFIEVAKAADVAEAYKKLLHHYDTTIGLYATDKPDMVVDKEGVLFQING